MYLSKAQISAMADAALESYEMSGDRSSAVVAAQEFCFDNFRVRPNRSAVLLAYKIAMSRWQSRVVAVQRELNA